jgi:NAD(P)H-dependent FMN reductase
MSSSLRITILFGSYREGRMGERAVKHVQTQLKAQGHAVTIVDAKAYDLPMLDKRFVDYPAGEAPAKLKELHTLFKSGTDAFVVVSGEYNGTMQPGLMNLMDHFYVEFFHRPVGLVTYSMGALGGARVSMHLLTILCVFGMSPIPSILSLSMIQNLLDEAGESQDAGFSKRSAAFMKELSWYGHAFTEAHKKGNPS